MLNDKHLLPPWALAHRELAVWGAGVVLVCLWAVLSRGADREPARATVSVMEAHESHDAAAPLGSGNWRLDLNTATQAELELLPGIGPHRARLILRERDKRGAFGSVWELCDVPELSRALVQKLEPMLRLASPSLSAPAGPKPENPLRSKR